MFLSLLQTTSSQVIYSSALTSWCRQWWRRKLKSHLIWHTRKGFSKSWGTGRGLPCHVRKLGNLPLPSNFPLFCNTHQKSPFSFMSPCLYPDRGPHIEKKISLMTLLNKLGSVCIKFVLVFGNFITVFIQITSLSVPILPKMSPLICFVPTRTGCGKSPLPLIPLGKSCQKQCVWCHKQDPRVMSQYIAPRFLLSTGTDNCQQDY